MSKYIVINSEDIQKRIDDLKKDILISESQGDKTRAAIETFEMKAYEEILSNSKPLTPIIEDAFDESRRQHSWAGGHIYGVGEYGQEEEDLTDFKYLTKQDYINNLKLDI